MISIRIQQTRALSQIQPTMHFYMACELRIIFTFLKVSEKKNKGKNDILWDTIIIGIQVLEFINEVWLGHFIGIWPHWFVYLSRVAALL